MTRVRCVQCLTVCVAVAVTLLLVGNVQAQKTKGKTRPATTKQLM